MKISKRVLLSVLLAGLVSACSSSSDKSGELSESDLGKDRFGEGGIPFAEGEGMFRDVHFDYDSSNIDGGAQQDIEYNAQVLKQNGSMKVILEGHCDDRGTNDYNMALGASRAKSVERALVALGISSSRLDTISYGEEVPLDPSQGEAAWAKNRRVHIGGASGKR